MPSTGVQDGLAVIERLRSEYAATPLVHDGGNAICVTASFGIAPIYPDISPGESIDRADSAMYAAKTEGRNKVRVWNPGITPRKRP